MLEHQPQRDPPGGHVLGWDRRLCSLVCVRVFRRLRPLQAQPHHCWARSRLGISKDVPGLTLDASQTPRLIGCVPSSGSLWSLVPDPGGLLLWVPGRSCFPPAWPQSAGKMGTVGVGRPSKPGQMQRPRQVVALGGRDPFRLAPVRLSVAQTLPQASPHSGPTSSWILPQGPPSTSLERARTRPRLSLYPAWATRPSGDIRWPEGTPAHL